MGCSRQSVVGDRIADTLRTQALEELRSNLYALPAWEKVHAAEYLLWLGYPDDVRNVFLKEERDRGEETPYRIGVWRVLVQCAVDDTERARYLDRIRAAYRDPNGPDRLHAVETLAKLGVPLLQNEQEATEEILGGETNRIFVYALWGASLDSILYQKEFRRKLLDLAASSAIDDILRLQAAFALRNLRDIPDEEWAMLSNAALAEDESSMAHIYLLSAACLNAPTDSLGGETCRKLKAKLLRARSAPQKGARMEMAYALGECGSVSDVEVLSSLLHNENPLNGEHPAAGLSSVSFEENADVRSSAAFGILRILQRAETEYF